MSRTVLIIEDSEACAETLQIAFDAIPNLTCRVVRTSKAALNFLEQSTDIAAIVTDLNLPQASGLDLIRRLRSDLRFSSLPMLLISGDSDPRLETSALAAGASAFFPKPYSPAAVRRKLEQLIC